MTKKKWVPAAVIGTVAVAGYVGAVAIAKHKIREVVDANLAQIEAHLKAHGQDAKLSYKEVSVHGFSLRPSAVVHDLELHSKKSEGGDEMIARTSEVHYYPYNFGMTSYRLEIPEKIEITHNNLHSPREQNVISYDSTPALDMMGLPGNEHEFQLFLPKSVVMTTLTETKAPEAAGENPLPPIDATTAKTERLELVQGETPYITWKTGVGGVLIEQKVILQKLTLNYQYDPFLTADQFTFNLNQLSKDDAGEIQQVASLLKLENLNFAKFQVANPINIVNDISYSGPIVLDEKTPIKPGAKFSWSIKESSLVTGLSSFFANGDITVQPDKERMPYGKISLRFDELQKLFDYLAKIHPDTGANLAKIRGNIERISGANIAQGDVVSIELVRDEGGRLQVGKLSLEEALAIGFEMLIDGMKVLSADEIQPVDESSPAPGTAPEAKGELVTPLDVTPDTPVAPIPTPAQISPAEQPASVPQAGQGQ